MMKKLISLVVSILLLTGITPVYATTTSEAYIPSEIISQHIVLQNPIETENKAELTQLITRCEEYKERAHAIAETARELGYSESYITILVAKAEWHRVDENQKLYEAKYNTILAEEAKIAAEEAAKKAEEERAAQAQWSAKAGQYPAATTIWRYLKNLGYNDYVCAGILGNMMAEVGGQTLDIRYNLQGNGYYGICQWSRSYSGVWGTNLNGQLNFLANTIAYEFNTYGSKYSSGFKYNNFLNLRDEKAVALAFAKCYERCGSGSYSQRQKNATVAYNYFTK